MRRSYSAAGTFSLSLSRLDIEKPPDDIHRWRRTNLSLLVYDYWLLYKVQHRADYQADIENTGHGRHPAPPSAGSAPSVALTARKGGKDRRLRNAAVLSMRPVDRGGHHTGGVRSSASRPAARPEPPRSPSPAWNQPPPYPGCDLSYCGPWTG